MRARHPRRRGEVGVRKLHIGQVRLADRRANAVAGVARGRVGHVSRGNHRRGQVGRDRSAVDPLLL
jgi:hypothetical protein